MNIDRETIIRMARKAGIVFDDRAAPFYERLIHSAYAAGAAAEREACAKVCEQTDEDGEGPDCWGWHSKDYAAAIRARGETTLRGQT